VDGAGHQASVVLLLLTRPSLYCPSRDVSSERSKASGLRSELRTCRLPGSETVAQRLALLLPCNVEWSLRAVRTDS
jgi:hypothetical protein